MKTRLIFAAMATAMLTTACSDEQEPASGPTPDKTKEATHASATARMSRSKATAIAKLFAPHRAVPDPSNPNKDAAITATDVTSISYYVEDGDTLLYAINYGNCEGYILVGGSLSSFPVIAQSEDGEIHFDKMEENSPLNFFIKQTAESVRELKETPDTTYAKLWADVDDDDVEYEIELTNETPEEDTSMNKSRSKVSSGLATIYPHTGLDLKSWGQSGDYDYAAENEAHIGCPAVAIGMLLYDVCNRIDGINQRTSPTFYYTDQYANNARDVSKRLREIADIIPNYNWGKNKEAESGATGIDIELGLNALGFKNIKFKSFNFIEIYKAMCKNTTDYFGKNTVAHRGVLLRGVNARYGHIWFCDGYYEQAYKITRKRKRLFHRTKIETWTEYENMLYMNWGDNGDGNGWYSVEGNYRTNSAFNNYMEFSSGLFEYTQK